MSIEQNRIQDDLQLNNRREFISSIGSGIGALALSSASLPSLRAQEIQTNNSDLVFQDLKKAYEIWKKEQPEITEFPTFEKFKEAIELCRQAVCTMYIINGDKIQASHSGFLVDIPNNRQTNLSYNKRYIITCDHARVGGNDGLSLLVFPNGLNVNPYRQIVEEKAVNGFPKKDLRIFECNNTLELNKIKGIPIQLISDELPINTPAITYQPHNLRKLNTYSSTTRQITAFSTPDNKPVPEKFILTRISNSVGYDASASDNRKPDYYYPFNTGYLTAGQLNVGGSGSPNILFYNSNFHLGGYQVSFIPEAEDPNSFNGEIKNDGRIVHINNAINLLKVYGLIK